MFLRALLHFVALLFIVPVVATRPLQEVLRQSIESFNDTRLLKEQFHLIADLTQRLLQKRAEELGVEAKSLTHHLRAVKNSDLLDDVLQSSTEILEPLLLVAEKDSILAIIARRTLLQYIAQHYIDSKPSILDLRIEARLHVITKQLYGIHVGTAVRKGLLDYLHISKSGGTSFSQAARMSHCRMAPGIGQPLYLGDLPHWVNRTAFKALTGGVHVTWSIYGRLERSASVKDCATRFANITAKRLQYVSNEYTLYGGLNGIQSVHVCPQGVNVVTLRHPDARLISHMHFLAAHMKTRIAHRTNSSAVTFRELFCTNNQSVWETVAPAIMDNYMTRSFLGERGFHSPVGSLGGLHLSLAQHQLLTFDMVMDLEAGEAAADTAMHMGLGWNVTLAEVHARSADHVSERMNYSREECSNTHMLSAVIPNQELDRQLYSTGRVLSFLDQLLLLMAQELGLQPTPQYDTTVAAVASNGNAAANAGAETSGYVRPGRCGLFGDGEAEKESTS